MSKMIEVNHLKKYFGTSRGLLHAVDDVNFSIEKGTTLGVVGESGCGKSTLGRVLIHLEESTEGQILFDGEDVTRLRGHRLHAFHERAQIVFQDPYSSVNPRKTVEDTIAEPLLYTKRYKRSEIAAQTRRLMDLVGIAQRLSTSYPHELDGGRRQRVVIARALALEPQFIVCDEPVSSLDVSIQAQVLNLLQDLQEERKLTYMFITHDLSVVKHISDQICVMYLGQMVETSPADELFSHPLHPYTKALLSAIPSTDIHHVQTETLLEGELTSPVNPKPGCRFKSRCPYASAECEQPQQLCQVRPGHCIACHRAQKEWMA